MILIRLCRLDSRCRKKEHTQKLEEERKILVHNLDIFQDQLQTLHQKEGMWLQERASWRAEVERLNFEKEELVRQHTLETAELRKKNSILLEDAQRRPSLSMSAVPSSAGYSSTFSEFDHLSMNDSPTWDNFSLIQHRQADSDASGSKPVAAPEHKEDSIIKDDDKRATSGLLFMLLLCGAWVASKGATSAADMPPMTDDVRAASGTILDTMYKDAGLAAPGGNISSEGNVNMAMVNHQNNHQRALNPVFNHANNPFNSFGHLTAPTLQQQRDDIFSLTPAQYNAMTTDDNLYSTPQSSPPKPRRTLQDSLAAMRLNKKGTASEVYAKSLLSGEVPTNVVRDFARMMGERNAEPMG